MYCLVEATPKRLSLNHEPAVTALADATEPLVVDAGYGAVRCVLKNGTDSHGTGPERDTIAFKEKGVVTLFPEKAS